MYGTVARMKILPGKEGEMLRETEGYRDLNIDGFIATALYRADAGDGEYWMAVVFENEAKYRANADSPEQDARFRRLRALMAADPEWHDGAVVSRQTADTRQPAS